MDTIAENGLLDNITENSLLDNTAENSLLDTIHFIDIHGFSHNSSQNQFNP